MAGVSVRNARKRYGDNTVIHDLDLDIEDREFMVLVGPSGCGKSTLLRMIAGLEEITGGEIRIGDRVVNDLPPKDRDIAMVFQNYALYPHMSVRQNLEFGLKMRKVSKAERATLVTEAAEILGLGEFLERKPRQLSGGQRQRVAVGRAIVRKPAVFLFDEPLSNLDAKLRIQMRAELTKLQQRLETTTIYVTHDQVEAMTMGHRIAVMNEGVLQQVGTPLELYEGPANVFVAQFIGTPPMSFVRASLADGQIEAAGFRLPVPASLAPVIASREGGSVVMGIRPERITSANGAGAGSGSGSGSVATVRMHVEVVEPLGHEVIVHGRVGQETLTAKLEPHQIPAVGSEIELAIALDHVHFFDPETEARLD